MQNQIRMKLFGILMLVLLITGCNGGGETVGALVSSDDNLGGDITNGENTATLMWETPVQNVDGSLLSDLSGFRIYYGTDPKMLTGKIDVSNPNMNSYTLSNLGDAEYYFVITAYDNSGNESSYSNIASKSFI